MIKKLLNISIILFAFVYQGNASQVDTIYISCESMNKKISNVIILPDSYIQTQDSFPVLYLLHGWSGDYSDWVRKVPKIKDYADQYKMIIICPDGGFSSWYIDSPIDDTIRYETYITEELVPFIDKNYRTKNESKFRAVTGLSMGGFGAFYLAFKHQDIWGAAGSMSGSFDLVANVDRKHLDLDKRLGDYYDNSVRWEKYSVTNMTDFLKGNSLKFIFDCGTDDHLYSVNNKFHMKLLSLNIPHDYIERAGKHDWNYWTIAVKYQFLFFREYFNSGMKEMKKEEY